MKKGTPKVKCKKQAKKIPAKRKYGSKVKKLCPMKANRIPEILRLRTDNYNPQPYEKNWGILVDDKSVHLHPPTDSEAMDYVTISRKQFDKLVKWYTKEQVLHSV